MSATTQLVQGVGHKPRAARTRRSKTRLRTRLHRRRIDQELVSGVDPNADPLCRERAGELVGERCRRRLAETLESLLLEADSSAHLFTSRVPLARAAIRDSRLELGIVIERLTTPAYISPRGVAMISVLLSDGAGPLYGRDPANSPLLRKALEAVVDCLDNGPFLVGAVEEDERR
ncbi:MAG TPA: hypothetical protein VIJ21_02455 [Solirubrobacterales bacterium]